MNPLEALEKNDRAMRELKAAEEAFRPKTFYETYRDLKEVSRWGKLFLPVISVMTGLTSLAVMLNLLIPYMAVCLVLGGLFLIGWEVMKAKTVRIATKLYLPSQQVPAFLVAVAVVFSAGSIAFSLHGTYEASRLLDKTEATNTATFGAQADSVQAYYADRIEQARTTARQYFAANNYQGTITYSRDNRFAKRYESLLAQAVELEQQRDAALAQLDTDRRSSLQGAKADWKRNTWAALALILIVEACILLANWFVIYFDFRSQQQVNLVRQQGIGAVTMSLDEIASVLRNFWPSLMQRPEPLALPTAQAVEAPAKQEPPQAPAQIGFAIPKRADEPESKGGAHIPNVTATPSVNPLVNPSVNAPVNPQKNAEFLAKYPEVVAAIRAGKGIGTTARECGVSESTVKNVKRVMAAVEG